METEQLAPRSSNASASKAAPGLSQEDIDALFLSQAPKPVSGPSQLGVRAFDFRLRDRIPKEQIRVLRAVHDNFARSLSSSLSAYLRTSVTANLISVEQLAVTDFAVTLPSPTCIAVVEIVPFDGVALLELNPSLAFPLVELLLGGGKVKPTVVNRLMTTIEQRVLDNVIQLALKNLAQSWQSVAAVQFNIESHENDATLVQALAPDDAIVVIATEIQIGETSGMMNIAIPSRIVKLLRQKFDQRWNIWKSAASQDEGERMLGLIRESTVELEATLEGSTVSVRDLVELNRGDILQFDQNIQNPAVMKVNGIGKWHGNIVISNRKTSISLASSIDAHT